MKKIAIEAVKAAGKESKGRYDKFNRNDSVFKSKHEILTQADLASEEIIIAKIKKNFPSHQILSEESGRLNNKSDYLWIIDPIDGTTNFSMHNPLWSISVGLSYRGEIIFGVVYAPILNEIFTAEKGKGAFLNGKKINVSKISKDRVLNTFCHGSREQDIKRAIKYYSYQKNNDFDCRQLGSAAIELSYVACGRIESIMIPGVNSWDVAAGVLLVREAGGRVTDFNNKKWTITSSDIVGSNGRVHKNIIKVLNR